MAQKFLSDIHATAGIKDSSGDLGSDGQVLSSTGAGTNWVNQEDGATVIYNDAFTATANQTVFTLSNSVDTEDKTQIYIDGAYQSKLGYTVNGTTLTFDTGLAEDSEVEVITFATALASNAAAVIRLDEFTGNNSTTDFALAQGVTDEKVTQVYINGVYQHKDTYSITDVTLTFSTAPPTSADIEVITFDTLSSSGEIQASSTALYVKNTSGSTIDKGTPVYITGSVGNSNTLTISPANASNASHMPSTGLLLTTLANNSFGYIITNGFLKGLTTNTIDGTSTSSNDTIYVKAGGGLTMTKPTGTNLIQNIGKVARSSGGNSGSILVSSILRSNDVPNIASGKIWVGDSNAVATERSLSGDATLSNTGALTLGTVPITKGGTGATSASAAKTALSLDNLDNTSDANKPVSTAGQTALDLKANIAGPTFTGNVIVSGNLQVDGTETIVNTETVEVEDNILQLNTTQGSPDTATASTSGISIYRGDGVTQASLIFDDADDTWDLTNNISVAGAATFSGNITVGDSHFVGDDSYDNLLIQSSSGENLNLSSANDLIFYTGGTSPSALGTQRLRIFNSDGAATFSGNVGIGTSGTPAEKLSVQGAIISTGGITGHGANRTTLSQEGANGAFLQSYGANTSTYGSFTFRQASSDFSLVRTPLAISSGGNVGIGTSSPTDYTNGTTLEIKGKTSSGAGLLKVTGADGAVSGALYASGSAGMNLVTQTNHSLFLGTNNSTKLTISSVGDVAIGSSASKGFLNSNGTAFELDVNRNPNTGIFGDTNKSHARIEMNGASGGSSILFKTASANNTTATTKLTISSDGFITQDISRSGFAMKVVNTADASQGLQILSADNDTGLYILDCQSSVGGTYSSKFVVEKSGNVGIGTTSPSAKLDITATRTAQLTLIELSTNTLSSANDDEISIDFGRGLLNKYSARISGYISNYSTYDGGLKFYTSSGGTLNTTPQLTITSGGDVFLTSTGGDVSSTVSGIALRNPRTSGPINIGSGNVTDSRDFVRFLNGNGIVGSISTNGFATVYATSSDYRLKENVTPITDALSRVNQLKPSRFNFIADADKIVDGFIAHEVEDIVPEAICGEKDALSEDGTPKYQGIDQSKIVPLLTAAIQEQQTIIEDLKSRIETLEG